MSDIAIRVEKLGKRYRIGRAQKRQDTLRDALVTSVSTPMQRLASLARGAAQHGDGRRTVDAETFWALRDVSFEVKRGEVVGIIGRNGAGKSTLLKILSRITKPTEGWADVYGKLGSLLEVGTGFHPELTGRENIYLSGAIMGMKKAELDRKLDEIVAFAEIEKFIDTPVKHYSSGMYVRLGFAVAAHLEPEILIVDEVLAVGDAAFQKKCLGKMGDIAREGRTVLFVSHNMAAINRLCRWGLWLDKGRLQMLEAVDGVVTSYLSAGVEAEGVRQWQDGEESPHNRTVRLRAVRILNLDGKVSSILDMRDPFSVEIEYEVFRTVQDLQMGLSVVASDGVVVFGTGDRADLSWQGKRREPGNYVSTCEIPGKLLNSGSYTVSIGGDIKFEEGFTLEELCLRFYVEQRETLSYVNSRPPGVVCPPHAWHVRRLI